MKNTTLEKIKLLAVTKITLASCLTHSLALLLLGLVAFVVWILNVNISIQKLIPVYAFIILLDNYAFYKWRQIAKKAQSCPHSNNTLSK